MASAQLVQLSAQNGVLAVTLPSGLTTAQLSAVSENIAPYDTQNAATGGQLTLGYNSINSLSHGRASASRATKALGPAVTPTPVQTSAAKLGAGAIYPPASVWNAFVKTIGVSNAPASSVRRTLSTPPPVGTYRNFYVERNLASANNTSPYWTPLQGVLVSQSAHGNIWFSSDLLQSHPLSGAQLGQIASDFEATYSAVTTHFASVTYTDSAPGVTTTAQGCDTNANPIGQVPMFVSWPGTINVYIVAPTDVDTGIASQISAFDFMPQSIFNCHPYFPIATPVLSNQSPAFIVSYNTSNTDQFEIGEDLITSFAFEMSNVASIVHKQILTTGGQPEDPWIGYGLASLAQDFAINQVYSNVPLDIDDDIQVKSIPFLSAPQNYSLTAMLDINGNLGYGCPGCVGGNYLFQRYLYERFGGDAYSHAVFNSTLTGAANLQAVTGVAAGTLLENFGGALLSASHVGTSSDPVNGFHIFNPIGTFTDQFGSAVTLTGVGYQGGLVPGVTNIETPLGGVAYYELTDSPHSGTLQMVDATGNALYGGSVFEH